MNWGVREVRVSWKAGFQGSWPGLGYVGAGVGMVETSRGWKADLEVVLAAVKNNWFETWLKSC